MLFCCWLFKLLATPLSWWVTKVYYQLSAITSKPNDQALTASALVHALVNPQELGLAYRYHSTSLPVVTQILILNQAQLLKFVYQ